MHCDLRVHRRLFHLPCICFTLNRRRSVFLPPNAACIAERVPAQRSAPVVTTLSAAERVMPRLRTASEWSRSTHSACIGTA